MDEEVKETAKRETARQAVILIFSVVGSVAMVYLARKTSDPDLFRTVKMAGALKVKRVAQRQVDWWQDVADRAATVYQRERL